MILDIFEAVLGVAVLVLGVAVLVVGLRDNWKRYGSKW